MTKYQFKQLWSGPRWEVIGEGYDRRSQGEAYARDWFAERGYTIIDIERDDENDAIDIMTAKGRCLYQFAVEPIRL